MKLRIPLTILLSLALLATACGTDEAGDPTTTDGPTTTSPVNQGDDSPLLIITDEGGFAPIEFVINRPPTYTLLNDGTLIFMGPAVGAFPGPVMPGMSSVRLTQDQMDDVRTLIAASGLPEVDEVVNNDAQNFVADATTTVARYFDDNGVHSISVYALGIDDNPPDNLANLQLLVRTLGDFTFGDIQPYNTDSVVVRIVIGGGFAEFDDTRSWSFSFEPDGDAIDAGQYPCLIFEGSAADELRGILSDATQATQWEHADGTFSVLARDLMPGEVGCDGL